MSRSRLGLYQPFIEDRNVRRLYQLKVQLNAARGRRLPMTVLLNRILDHFFETSADATSGPPPWITSGTAR